jgi:hypothetical protein
MRISFCFWCAVLVIHGIGMGFSQDTNFATGPQYLLNSGSPLFARSISTPTVAITSSPLEVGSDDATETLIPGAEDHTALSPLAVAVPTIDLFPIYYGEPPASVIEVTLPGQSMESSVATALRADTLDTGVEQVTTALALRDRGYGVPLAEAAVRLKARSHPPARVYTNADIERLQGGK